MTSITVQSLDFAPGVPLRSFLIEGKPWFVAIDVCTALGLTNTSKALGPLKPEQRGVTSIQVRSSDGTEQAREFLTISESGLYRLVMRSRKAAAEAFQDWVVETVLPALRQHGLYVVGEEKPITEDMTEAELRALTVAAQTRLGAIYAQKEADMAAMRLKVLESRKDRDEAHQSLKRLFGQSKTRSTPGRRVSASKQGPKARTKAGVIACKRRAVAP